MPFSTGTGLERTGFVGPDCDYWRAGLQAPGSSGLKWDCCSAGPQALNVALLCKKNKKEGGSAGASPVAAPMPKSVSFLEKRETALRPNVLQRIA